MTHVKLLAALVVSIMVLPGCRATQDSASDPPPKLAELASRHPQDPIGTGLGVMSLRVHLYQVPAEYLPRLSSLWKVIKTQGVRYKNHQAFHSNAFRVGTAHIQQWDWIEGVLTEARAKKIRTSSLMLSEEQDSDLTVRSVSVPTTVSYVDQNGIGTQTRLPAGTLALRFRADRLGRSPAYRMVAYPALALAVSQRLPRLTEQLRRQEQAFMSAAFSAHLQPGDVVVIGPEEYLGSEATLGGLFFHCETKMLFMDPHQPKLPQTKPAVRLYAVVCTAVRIPGTIG